jgi:serine/threonine protein kinase
MSPEMILGHGYNQKIDCYSWAMVFYEILSLQKPYASYNREVHRILVCENNERPYPSVDIPQDARSLLEQAWAQDPDERPSAQDICNVLEPIIETAERASMSPMERSLKVVMEMAELLDDRVLFSNQDTKRDDSFLSRKSTAELTTTSSSSSACASTEASSLLFTPPVVFC